ncbi:hypothetical protein BGY98DRAFT_967416, partial [Russula aff. rugulosa BPL654]
MRVINLSLIAVLSCIAMVGATPVGDSPTRAKDSGTTTSDFASTPAAGDAALSPGASKPRSDQSSDICRRDCL